MILYGYITRRGLGLMWANIFLSYGLIPLLDQKFKEDWQNPTLEEVIKL